MNLIKLVEGYVVVVMITWRSANVINGACVVCCVSALVITDGDETGEDEQETEHEKRRRAVSTHLQN